MPKLHSNYHYDKRNFWNEWMNECLTTPQHEKDIDYFVSDKDKCNEIAIKLKIEKHYKNTV